MYDAQKLGGAFSLVAMQVPEKDFDMVAEIVNSYAEVAHNYQRDHDFNMWYVLATETPQQIDEVNHDIEQRTGLKVFNMPKLDGRQVLERIKAKVDQGEEPRGNGREQRERPSPADLP